MEDHEYAQCWLPPELVKPLPAVGGKLKSVAPGAQVCLSICAGKHGHFMTRSIQVACFEAQGDLVATPLQRLPALLRSVTIRGFHMMGPNEEHSVIVGIPEEEPIDGEPDLESDSGDHVFKNMSPWTVDWGTFGRRELASDIQLTFENINTVPVHIFVRINGEPAPAWGPGR